MTDLFKFSNELTNEELTALRNDVESIDLAEIKSVFEKSKILSEGSKNSVLAPFPAYIEPDALSDEYQKYYDIGVKAIKNGEVICITMAGGQGSRLGFTGPKGAFNIGLCGNKSIFEYNAESLIKTVTICKNYIDWYIMTSEGNDAETKDWFSSHNYFGYPKEYIHFFCQSEFPVVDLEGNLLLANKHKVLRAPNGNGGIFEGLAKNGILDESISKGVKLAFVHNVDNILVKLCDPMFIGYSIMSDNDAVAKTVMKKGPYEKAGVYSLRDNKPSIIEYTEVSEEMANAKNPDGTYEFGDVNVGIYAFKLDSIKAALSKGLPYHPAYKKVKHLDEYGNEFTAETPDCIKFEMFLFDIFDHFKNISIFRVKRENEFAPCKNKEGEDSPKTARNLYMKLNKIKMQNPIVEMDGDEMTRIIWQKIKEIVLLPFIDLNTEYFDLSIQNRDATDDLVTTASANATKLHKVAVKCATITPNAQRVEEYGLKKMWKSPNGTIRGILGGTVFRAPILVDGIKPYVRTWTKPITIARHAYGDIYSAVESKAVKGSVAKLVIENPDGTKTEQIIKEFTDSDGIVMGMHNKENSIENFAKACFEYAISEKQDLWFCSKDTISKTYDHTFKDIFQKLYDNNYKERFEELGIKYFYTLVDDAIARVMKSEGGFIWATKNYDGDVFSDMLASSFGSLSMMTSVLVSPDGYFEYEAAHGTIPRHYHRYLNGEKTSTNPIATLFAWTGALRKRGEFDSNSELIDFANRVEKCTIELVESGFMTGDLALLTDKENVTTLSLDEFLTKVAENIY